MKYVLDTGFFIFSRQYYPEIFKTFWEEMNEAIAQEIISSVDEVYEELEAYGGKQTYLLNWIKTNKHIFTPPNTEEQNFIAQMFSINDFQKIINHKQLLNGKAQADPFVIAKAKINQATVVTIEEPSKQDKQGNKHKFKMPDVCEYFNIPCISPQEFMAQQGWTF